MKKKEKCFIWLSVMMEGTSKKRKGDPSTTIDQKLEQLEEQIEKLEKKKPRKNIVTDLDENINLNKHYCKTCGMLFARQFNLARHEACM